MSWKTVRASFTENKFLVLCTEDDGRVFPCYLEGREKDLPIRREQRLKRFSTLVKCVINPIWNILETVFLAFLIIQHFSIYNISFFITECVHLCVVCTIAICDTSVGKATFNLPNVAHLSFDFYSPDTTLSMPLF